MAKNVCNQAIEDVSACTKKGSKDKDEGKINENISQLLENKNVLLFANLFYVAGVDTICLLVVRAVCYSPNEGFDLSSIAKINLVLKFF